MKRAKRPVVATVLASALMLGALPLSGQARPIDEESARPGEVAMIGDSLIARPVLAAATVVGTALYAVTLPFSVLGGNEDEAAEKLVRAPARNTFLRCLGCTPAQHERLQAEQTIDKANN